MSRNAVHAIRSRIVNLAAQPNFTFRAHVRGRIAEITQLTASSLSRCDAGLQRRARTEAGVRHSQWSKDVLLRKLIERHAAHARHDFAERDETDVAVSETRAGRVAQRLFNQPLDRFVVAGPTLSQIEVRRVAADVRQQLFDRDALSSLTRQLGNVK